MTLRDALSVWRANWWLPALGMVVGGLLGFSVGLLSVPMYAATTGMFVSTTESSSSIEALQGSQFSQQRVQSYARLLTGDALAQRVIDRLGIGVSARDLSTRISATAVPNTVLLDVIVTDPNPDRARQIADAIGQEFPDLVSELETPESGGASPVKVTVIDRPDVSTSPVSPQPVRNSVLGVALGLLLGLAGAVGRTQLDRSVKSRDVASGFAGAPVIGAVVRDQALEKRHIVVGKEASRSAEDYRQLRTNLQFLNVDDPPKVIMVSSAMPSEGKSTVVVNLGLALADAGHRVVIVEADLRRPKVTRYLGMVGGVGLTNVLAGTAGLEEVRQSYGSGALSVIAAGPIPPNPGELLSSSHMSSLVQKLRGEFDYVLVDAPPLLPVADSTGLAVIMDGVLLSVRYGTTTKDQLGQAAATLNRVGAKTLGVILNIVPPKAEAAGAYGYGYAYDAEPQKGRRRA